MTSRSNTSGSTYTQRQPSRRAMSPHVGCHHGSEPSASAGISEGVNSKRGSGGGGGSEFCRLVPCSMSPPCPLAFVGPAVPDMSGTAGPTSVEPLARDRARHNPSTRETLQMLDTDSPFPLSSCSHQRRFPGRPCRRSETAPPLLPESGGE